MIVFSYFLIYYYINFDFYIGVIMIKLESNVLGSEKLINYFVVV